MIIIAVCVASALIGGWLGWRRGTNRLFARSFDPMLPAHGSTSLVGDELAKRRRSRLITTFLYALAGPAVAIIVMLVLIRVR